MLPIINDLKPFFEDNYIRIHVREFAKMQNISPPTASKKLEYFRKEGLLNREIDKQYYYYFTNKASCEFRDLQRMYWRHVLKETIGYIQDEIMHPTIILFGSLAKGEATKDSDIDLAIFSAFKKEIPFDMFEKKINRSIQCFYFKNVDEIPQELKRNILNGYIIEGKW